VKRKRRKKKKMSKESDWTPEPGGVWDTFFRELGFDNGESEEEEE
jgi:hypothetical protein